MFHSYFHIEQEYKKKKREFLHSQLWHTWSTNHLIFAIITVKYPVALYYIRHASSKLFIKK